MNLYTIGFAGKNAEIFFEVLKKNEIKRLIDIRLNNVSQLAGFAKKLDLKYFLRVICNIDYIYKPEYAPTKQLLDNYKNHNIAWSEYVEGYTRLLHERNILNSVDYSLFDQSVLLCSEKTPEHCHRRLLAEYFAEHNNDLIIIHL